MHFSERIKAMQSSPIRRLLPFSDEAKKAGKKVYHLNIGQPDIKTPEEYFRAVRDFKADTIAYAASQGNDGLRDAISAYYASWDIPYERNDIYITNGGSEALWFAVMAICDAGDELLVPEPFYANYNAFAQASLAKLVPIPTKAEEGFHLPPASVVEGLITPRTRAIWISNPGNPTGAVYTAAELEMLASLAKKHDIYLISDEVYREFTYDGEKFTSLGHMKDVLDRVIMVDSVSKRFSACGARIGCIAIKNREFLAQALKLCQGRLCVSTLEQVAATGLYKTSKSYLEEVNKEYRSRRDTLYKALKRMDGVVCEEPKGAFYVMVKMPVDDAEKFIVWMLQNYDQNGETMMGAPGSGFYSSDRGKDEMRLAYVLKNEDLLKATRILEGALKVYPGRIEAIKA
ncbi:MAG: pyridoxal phosphate-dependent aminotransferase [Synergistaceae bacterium]|jgi:aspartate aminotransferase|nr:pyridoxal phosphate-dependent aminotransferase [Synergistaceae bacterium]